MKTIQKFMILLLIGSFLSTQAQVTARKGWDGVVKGGPRINVSYNSTMPNSATKDAYVGNSSGISGDIYIPFQLFRKGWDGTVKGGSFGFNIGGTYNFGGNGDPSVALPNPFKIFGETASSVAYKGVDPKNPGFRIGGGPQANFNFGEHFTISPMVLAEYFSMTQKEVSAVQTTQINGKTKEYNLWTLPETKTTGLAITPKVRLRYMFTQNLGVFADGAYIFGPKINTQTSTLKPLGNPNQAGQYDQQQLDLGTQVKSDIKSTSYNAFAINVGLSFDFGKSKKGWNGVSKSDDKGWNGATKNNEKGWNGIANKNVDPRTLQNIQVNANGGVENLAGEITKSGKAKASVVMNNGKKVLKVVTQEGEYYTSDFYTFEENPSGPSNIINGGYTTTCKSYQCPTGCILLPNGFCSPCTAGGTCTRIDHNEWDGHQHDYLSIVEGLIPIDPNNTSGPHKGWDGTIHGLFDIKTDNIAVTKSGGIEKLIEKINKGGKGKASIYKLGVKEFIKVETKTKSENISDFYPIDDNTNGQFRYINNGSYNPRCTNRTGCNDCRLDGELNPVTGSGYLCKCGETSSTVSAPDCNFSNGKIKISDFMISSQIKNLAVTLESDETTLTSGSIRNIKDLMLQTFPKAKFIKAEILKENKDKFVKVQLDDNGNPITLINMTFNPGRGWLLIGCKGTCNGSVYGCESKNINIVGACGCAGDNSCFGISGLFEGVNSNITIEK